MAYDSNTSCQCVEWDKHEKKLETSVYLLVVKKNEISLKVKIDWLINPLKPHVNRYKGSLFMAIAYNLNNELQSLRYLLILF